MARARTALAAAAALLWAGAAGASAGSADALAWAEEVRGAEALARTAAWTAATRTRLEAVPGFAATRARAAALLNDPRQIAYGRIEGGLITNVWQDAGAPRGKWRAAQLDAYLADAARWRTLLDLDALARAEGRAWVWRGATCRPSDHVRCLVALSDGGRDAVELREFDLAEGRFVDGGFRLREAKQQAAWLDDDTILLQSDFGPGTLTEAGYGRQVRRVARGQDPASAPVLLEGAPGDVGVSPLGLHDGRRAWPMLRRATGFWSARLFHLAPDGRLIASPLPDHAAPEAVVDGWLVARLGADWTLDSTTHPGGALVALSLPALEAGQPAQVERV
ncbi:MAG: S9 family peptidase, partial [Sphingomonadaceae bacterium]